MSYTELESGYQGLKQNRPGFYVGHDGNLIALVSDLVLFLIFEKFPIGQHFYAC